MSRHDDLSDLRAFLAAAARVTGAEEEDSSGRQAKHSLAWYFEKLLERDLDPKSPSYSPLLDAYLHENASQAIKVARETAAEREEVDDALVTRFPQSSYSLNESQTRAVHAALANPLTVIIGPPGTGKTETILRILALAVERGESVAMVSSNHSAVNTVIEKVEAARVEGPAPRGDLMARLAERLVPLGNARDRKKACDASGASFGFSTRPASGESKAHADLASGWEQHITLRGFCNDALGGSRCVTSTIHSLKKCFVDGDVEKYDLVVVDEASQSSPLLGIIALSSARRIVIVGDDEQLPPVVNERLAETLEGACGKELCECFAHSPFDVADANHPTSFLGSCRKVFCSGPHGDPRLEVMLDEHYRCHPAIIGFCNEYVYEGKLKVKTKVAEDTPAFPIGVRWYDGDYREPDVRWERSLRGAGHWRGSVCNMRQASIIEREELPHIEELVRAGKSICFLSPFWAQVEEVARVIKEGLPDIADQLGFGLEADGADSSGEGGEEVECALTVHRSQGKEFDCVYLLPVEDGKWAWPWSQGRRLVNVAVSRAKAELHVIVSTKLMYEDDQRDLTGRVTTPDAAANLDDEAEERENLFVCKLVRYVRDHEDAWSAPGQPDWCGMRRTAVSSVFDWSANLLGHSADEGEEALSVPEWLVACGLAHASVDAAEGGLAVASGVKLDKLSLDGKRLVRLAYEHFSHPDLVHFDFAVFEHRTQRVVALVEVDGAQHRFAGFADPTDGATRGRKNMATELQRDWEKERLVRDLGGTCVWLGTPTGHQLTKTVEFQGREKVIPGDLEENGAPGAGDANRLAGWVTQPSGVPASSRFLFIRIPADGSTAFEFDALAVGAGGFSHGPSADSFLRRQLVCGDGAASLMIEKDCPAIHVGAHPSTKRVSDLCKGLGLSAQQANRRLVEMGVLYAQGTQKRPTDLGSFLGVMDVQPKGASYHMPVYDQAAEAVLMALLSPQPATPRQG